MADGQYQDNAQKTEEPTQRRLQEAREKGRSARSPEVSHWFMILAFAIYVGVFAPATTERVAQSLLPFVERPHAIATDPRGLQDALGALMRSLGLALLPVLGLVVAAALMGSVAQSGINLSLEPLKPKLEKLSAFKGVQRLFSLRSLAEFAKGLAKLGIVAAVVGALIWPERHVIPNLAALEPGQLLALLQGLALRVLLAVLAVMTIVAGLDFLYQRQQHLKQLRMSRRELRDELKQTEGDPLIKARLRQIRLERARRRMIAAVPEADVVVTNPTHYAVALKYESGTMEAPKVTAKGVDFMAQQIRTVAEENDVPMVENPPLARVLYSTVDLDQEIPPAHYKAVAEIIGYVMRLKSKAASGKLG